MKKQLPIHGEIRIIKRFALFPILCRSREFAWFETVYVKQKYSYGYMDYPRGWIDMCFVDEDEYDNS